MLEPIFSLIKHFDNANPFEVNRMIQQTVHNLYYFRDTPPEHNWLTLWSCEPHNNILDQREWLAEAQKFSSHRHAGLKSVKPLEEERIAFPFTFECWQQEFNEVLHEAAHLTALKNS